MKILGHSVRRRVTTSCDEYRAAGADRGLVWAEFGEIAELRRRDLDLDGCVVKVRRAITHVDGQPVVGVSKSHAGVRDVAIPPHLIEPLANHLRRHVPAAGTRCYSRRRAVAPTRGRCSPRGVPCCPRRRWTARSTPHDLRHTGAMLAAATGATLAELMRRIAYSTPHAAMRYQPATDDRDQTIADALSGFATAKIVELRPRRSAESS
jgi:integrase